MHHGSKYEKRKKKLKDFQSNIILAFCSTDQHQSDKNWVNIVMMFVEGSENLG